MAANQATKRHANFKDRTGQRHGKLVVIGVSHFKNHKTWWKCLCDCGNTAIVVGQNLSRPHTLSCGCHKLARISASHTTHGKRGTPEYATWGSIKNRCTNPNQENYERYGLAGVTMCQRWMESFEAFYADMGPKPSTSHTIDRIKNELGYEPGNCRWATRREQAQNTRKSTFLTFRGITKPTPEWAREFGIRLQTLHGRISHGWSIEAALTTPVAPR